MSTKTGARNWADASLTDLCDHIEQTHHAYLRTEMPRLLSLLKRIATRHGQEKPKLVQVRNLFARFMVDMLKHMDNEEHFVFSAARKLDRGIVEHHDRDGRDPIQAMMEEHDEGGMTLLKMRELTDGYTSPPEACETFKQVMHDLEQLEHDMHEHVYKENCILALKAEQAQRRLLAHA